MKRIKKLFLILLLIMPVYIGASSKKDYASSVNEANNYTSKNFASSYTKYIQNIPGVKFISKDEYNASKNNNGMSYLNDGFDMFTNSEEGSNV